jgi:hypothetical protein
MGDEVVGWQTFKIGPFTLYRCNDHLDVYITAMDGWAFGWEYGPNKDLDVSTALLHLNIYGLNVLHVEFFRWGFDLRVLGFWMIV